jgi:hypothetical protein
VGRYSISFLLAIHVAPVQQACRGGDAQGRWGSAQEHRAGGTPMAACELACFNLTIVGVLQPRDLAPCITSSVVATFLSPTSGVSSLLPSMAVRGNAGGTGPTGRELPWTPSRCNNIISSSFFYLSNYTRRRASTYLNLRLPFLSNVRRNKGDVRLARLG